MFFERATRLAFGLGGGAFAPISHEPPTQPPMTTLPRAPRPRPKLGLALGGGAARGWAHIGALEVLRENDIKIEVVAGTSIGAVVGGCFAAGKLDAVKEFALSLTRRRMVALMDVHLGSGLIGGERLRRLLERDVTDVDIDGLPMAFAAIATELVTGHEIWLTHGPLVDAMRASYALPGIFDPVKIAGRWLMDGALVNPVPVTAARALGAELVISINLNAETMGRGAVIPKHGARPPEPATLQEEALERGMFGQMRDAASRINPFGRRKREKDAPKMASVVIDAFNITQDRIARARLAGDPPDVMVTPRLARIGLFEFHRAAEAIKAGREAAEKAMPELLRVLEAEAERV